jgi:RNA recognition motif-containing protein
VLCHHPMRQPNKRQTNTTTVLSFIQTLCLRGRSIYIRNINNRTKPAELVPKLHDFYSHFGTVLDVIAKKNLRARGQAFVVFEQPSAAVAAVRETNGFELLGQPIEVKWAKAMSDVAVKRMVAEGEDSKLFEDHKKRRIADKGTSNSVTYSPLFRMELITICQNGNKPHVLRSSNLNEQHSKRNLQLLALAYLLSLNSSQLQILARKQTSICPPTRRSLYAILAKKSRRMRLRPYSPDLSALRRFGSFPEERESHLLNMNPKMERSKQRRKCQELRLGTIESHLWSLINAQVETKGSQWVRIR